MTRFQETVEPEKQRRVFSYVRIVMALATPIGLTAFGPLADVVPVETLLVLAGLLTIVVFVVALRVPSGRAAAAAGRQADEVSATARMERGTAAEAT